MHVETSFTMPERERLRRSSSLQSMPSWEAVLERLLLGVLTQELVGENQVFTRFELGVECRRHAPATHAVRRNIRHGRGTARLLLLLLDLTHVCRAKHKHTRVAGLRCSPCLTDRARPRHAANHSNTSRDQSEEISFSSLIKTKSVSIALKIETQNTYI